MPLTPRQKQFLEALAELCRVGGSSVHYSAVAEALSVSPFSAYDMLKVLESKGAVVSEYVLDGTSPGPGRSAIMFRPSPEWHGGRLLPGSPDELEWSGVERALLQRLADVRDANVREVLGEILGRLGDLGSPLSYCTGVIAALLVNLRTGGRELFSRTQLPTLRALASAGQVGLGTLAGLSIGHSLSHLRGAASPDSLLQPVRRFQTLLAALNADGQQRLAEFLGKALSAIERAQA